MIGLKKSVTSQVTVVQTKGAALHYKSNIAELFATGTGVGDYGHSPHLFVPMLKAAYAYAYVDKEVTTFLSTPLSNTGLSPHFYEQPIKLPGMLVLVMLRGQQLSCPGWKIAGWNLKVTALLNLFAVEITMEKSSRSAFPRSH